MATQRHRRLFELQKQAGPEVILRAASVYDGHTIPRRWPRRGCREVVDALTTTYRSDGTPKGTIFVEGEPVPELRGVYGLDALKFMATALGVKLPSFIGRGFQAQGIQRALHDHFKKKGADGCPTS